MGKLGVGGIPVLVVNHVPLHCYILKYRNYGDTQITIATGSLFIIYLCGLEVAMKPCYANFEVNYLNF